MSFILKHIRIFAALLLTLLAGCNAADDNNKRHPPSECNLRLDAPVSNWYEGVPLGNGQLGALICGQTNHLVVKLDRLDIWDERCTPDGSSPEFTWRNLKLLTTPSSMKLIESHESVTKKGIEPKNAPGYGKPFRFVDNQFLNLIGGSSPFPTHIAMGKLLVTMPLGAKVTALSLDLASAVASISFQDGRKATAITCATEPVMLMLLPDKPDGIEMWAPGIDPKWPVELGYPAPVMGKDEASLWYEQSIPEGPTYGYNGTKTIPSWKFVVFARTKAIGSSTLVVVTVTSSQKDGADPLEAARARTDKALKLGYNTLFAAHQKHYAEFWKNSAIDIPDQSVLQQYYLTRYYLAASSAPGFAAMGVLMSIWTDDKLIPSFKNNLHNDLETQVQYQSYLTAGNFAEGKIFFDYLYDLLPTFRGFARTFYETGGAAVPGHMSLGGNVTSGWPQYLLSPTQAGWFGWLFYQHWRYTQDREFLETRAYPWCAEIAECWKGLLKADENGVLKLPLSTSPEIFNNSPRSWLKPNSNYDLDCMQAHLLGLVEMATALGKAEDAERWRTMAGKLGPRHVDEENVLMWSENEKVAESHRHFSHIYSIWPYNMITIDGSDRDRQIIVATMKRFDQLGDGAWVGFSWPWMSSIRSRVGDAESAYKYLYLFVKGFISRNGFDMNSDLHGVTTGKTRSSDFFTIEANMLANQAVHDMLIQSWAPSIGKGEAGIVRLFPSTPWSWHDASFEDLRAEGGFRVSAKRKNNATVWFKITAEADGLLRLRDNFDGRAPKWVSAAMLKVGQNFEKPMLKGETIEATLETPKSTPHQPENAYVPITPTERK